MGLPFLVAGFIFFFLPNFSIIDILPDFIGCLLIIIGLNKLADLTPGLYDARKAFVKVMYIHIAKFFLMFALPFFGNQNGGDGYVLIFSFTFAVLDFIYTLPAFKSLLNGFVYLGDRTNAAVLFENQSEFSTLTSAFIIIKATMAFLPDLSFISNPESSNIVASSGSFYISNYKTLLVLANFLITGIIGVVWLVYAVRYFNGIKNDKILLGALTEKYKNDILSQKGLFIRRGIKLSFTFIMIGGVLMTDYLIDLVNVIPDFLGALFFLLSAIILRKYVKTKYLLVHSILFLCFSVVTWVMFCAFAIRYPSVNIWTNIEAYYVYIYLAISNTLKCTVQALVYVVLFAMIKNIINTHTGSSVNELHSISLARKKQQEQLRKNNLFILVFGLITVVLSILRVWVLFDHPGVGVVDSVISVVYSVCLIKLLTNVNNAVEYRYL